MKLLKKQKVFVLSAAICFGMVGATAVCAAAKIEGHLTVDRHYVPLLKDQARAFTSITKPTKDVHNCGSRTTVKIYNSSGDSDSGSYEENGHTWDLPVNAGAYANIRGAVKAKGTHKARSYDTGYNWQATSDTYWEN